MNNIVLLSIFIIFIICYTNNTYKIKEHYSINNIDFINYYPYHHELTTPSHHYYKDHLNYGLTYHFYDFDKTITMHLLKPKQNKYTDLSHMDNKIDIHGLTVMGNTEKSVHEMYHKGELIDIFGGFYRIDQLRQYFETLKRAGVKLFIVSYNNKKIIEEALGNLNLYEYFDEVHGNNGEKKEETIREIMNKLDISNHKSIFIGNNNKQIHPISHFMQTYKVTGGINELDMNRLLHISLHH